MQFGKFTNNKFIFKFTNDMQYAKITLKMSCNILFITFISKKNILNKFKFITQ